MRNNELYNQVLDCNVCKVYDGVCKHCTEAMEEMRGATYPVIDLKKAKEQRRFELTRI